MKKFLIAVLLLLLAAGGAVYVARETLLRRGLETAVTQLTGFKTTVDHIRLDLYPTVVHLQNLKIYNPKAFKKEIFADIPEIYIEPDLAAILKKESLHIREIRFAVQEINVVKDEKGVSNIQMLSSVGQSAGGDKAKAKPQPAPKQEPALPFKLDRFELTLRKVSFEDHSEALSGKMVPKTVSAGINRGMIYKKVSVDLNVDRQIFENITDPKAIVNVVLMKILYGTTFGNLLGLDPSALAKDLTNTVSASADELKQTATEVLKLTENMMKDTVGTAKGILNEATQTVNVNQLGETTGQLADKTETAVKETLGQAKQELTGLFGKFKSKLNTQGESGTSSSDSEPAQ